MTFKKILSLFTILTFAVATSFSSAATDEYRPRPKNPGPSHGGHGHGNGGHGNHNNNHNNHNNNNHNNHHNNHNNNSGSHHGSGGGGSGGGDFLFGALFGSILAILSLDAAEDSDDFNRLTIKEFKDALETEIVLNDGDIESEDVLEVIDMAREKGVEGSDREIAEQLLETTDLM